MLNNGFIKTQKMKKIYWLFCIILGLNSVFAQNSKPENNVYDFYVWGIHYGILEIDHTGNIYTIQLRNQFKDWKPKINLPFDSIKSNKEFRFLGSVSDFPLLKPKIELINWNQVDAIGFPDIENIYVKQHTITKENKNYYYWAQNDASRPLDLIINEGNELIAAIDVSLDFIVVKRGYENLTTLKEWNSDKVSQAIHTPKFHGKFNVKVAKDVILSTLVYLPDNDMEKHPVIFIRTPYGITNIEAPYLQYVLRGYAVVLQAARGTAYWDQENKSDGEWKIMINEPNDGGKSLEWIVNQDWCDGNIGMIGGSYLGYTQWASTMSNNPALKCIIPEVSMGTAFSDQPFMGGGFVEGLAYYMFWMLDKPILENRNWTEILKHRPLVDIDKFATGEEIPAWNKLFEHWVNDSYWQKQNWYKRDINKNVGSFQISGWFDDDFPGTRSNWAYMQQKSNVPQKLIIGPWKHGYNLDRKLNGFSFSNDALRQDIYLLKQKWFDYYLKGIQNGIDSTKVDYFILGSNKWAQSGEWPPKNVQEQKWYFHSKGEAAKLTNNGILNLNVPKDEESAEVYQYDPNNPVYNWYNFDYMKEWQDVQSFPYDFRDIEKRNDVVVYTSDALEEDLTITGNILIKLFAATDVKDTDWWVYLSDVYPDGTSERLTVGMLRARFRNLEDKVYHVFGSNFEKEELLSGNIDDVVEYDISIPAIANTFKKGHRIRVAIMNSHANYSFPNSNTGEKEGYVTKSIIGNMKIFHTDIYPSHIVLPVFNNSMN